MGDFAKDWTQWQLDEMEQHLDEIYARAYSEVEAKATEYFRQFHDEDAVMIQAVKDGRKSERQYKKWKKEKVLGGEHWEDMKKQLVTSMLSTNQDATAYINDSLPDIYAVNYNEVASDISDYLGGYSFDLVDAHTVRRLAADDETLLPYKVVNGKKDERWNTQKVNAEVLQGIIQGDSIENLAKRLQNVVKMNAKSAIRNARTTVTSAENKGRIDMLHTAQAKGIECKKVWLSTNDGRTRDVHRHLNGQQADPDEPFKSDLGDIMYPGDVDAEPGNVYNCRCTLTYEVLGFGKKKGKHIFR